MRLGLAVQFHYAQNRRVGRPRIVLARRFASEDPEVVEGTGVERIVRGKGVTKIVKFTR